jgi:tripartite-type tricarboxylate transporter receptor subunit TctC
MTSIDFRPSRRNLIAGALSLPIVTSGARAADWPTGQTIKIVVPFAPGGSTDAIARMTQVGFQQRLGATLVIENRAGGNSAIGAAIVAKAQPDGLTWLNVFDSHAALPALMQLTFDIHKDLEPVMLIGVTPMVVACHPNRPFKTFADVIAAAKAKPGTLTFGTIGNGSLGHLGMTLLEKKAGFSINHVPYRGGGPALNDALGGQIDMIIGSAALLSAQIDANSLRPLLQTGAARLPNLKETQTAIEAGFTDFTALSWWGVFAPGKTPRPIIDRYAQDLRATLRDPAVAKQLKDTQQVDVLAQGPDEFKKFFEDQVTIWSAVIKENNIKPD